MGREKGMKNTCIVIDDMKSHQLLLSQMAEICGLQVIGVGDNGKDAVELFKNHTPDIVFLDMRMPVCDGFYAINGIRDISNSAIIIAVTADDTGETFEILTSLQIPVISKPYTIDDIKKSLNEYLQFDK